MQISPKGQTKPHSKAGNTKRAIKHTHIHKNSKLLVSRAGQPLGSSKKCFGFSYEILCLARILLRYFLSIKLSILKIVITTSNTYWSNVPLSPTDCNYQDICYFFFFFFVLTIIRYLKATIVGMSKFHPKIMRQFLIL